MRMKPKLVKSFEELIAGYYGARETVFNDPTTVEELFRRYYGQPEIKRAPKARTKPAVVLSLRCDDGETLQQRRKRKVRQYTPVATQTSLVRSFDTPPAQEVNPSREVQADLLDPPKTREPEPPVLPAPRAPILDPPQLPAPSEPSSPPQLRKPKLPLPPDTIPLDAKAGQAQANPDDEFAADLQAILTGKKVFDPVSGKTLDKEKVSDARANPQAPPALPSPGGGDGQAIFDRIAQSMQHANAFDLGTVELQNRFADFDRMSDLQRRAAKEKKGAKSNSPVLPPGEPPKTPSKPDNQEFLRDLDAIRNQQATTEPADMAESLSVSGDIAEALYDTGEHVLAAETMFPDKFVVGKPQSVKFSYGQLIAMADVFGSATDLMNADPAELQKIKTLVERSTQFYKSGTGADVKNKEWKDATGGRYLKLAEDNYDHFAPNLLSKGPPPKVALHGGNHKAAWEKHHKWAMEEVRKDPHINDLDYFPHWPLLINAFGDHFLTDAFAAGHVVNKAAVIDDYKSSFYTKGALTADGMTFFNKLAAKAFGIPDVARKFSKLDYGLIVGTLWGKSGKINSANSLAGLLIKIAEEEPDRIGNLAIKALHDELNKVGIRVNNAAGTPEWNLTGDGHLTKETLAVMRQAVQQSVANIQDPAIRTGAVNFQTYFDKVWRYVPKLTPASEAIVKSMTVKYVTPTSTMLVDAAANLIKEEVDTLIEALIDKGVLK